MAVLRIQEFSAVVPVKGDRALPENFAVESENTWLYGSELRGLRPPTTLQTVEGDTRKVLRIPLVSPPSDLTGSTWVRLTDIDTDIMKGQLVEDSFNRWYFCSPTDGPWFAAYDDLAASGDGAGYALGCPGPDPTPEDPNATPPVPANIWKPKVTKIEPYNVGKGIFEIEFKASDTDTGDTNYTNAISTGDRRSIMVVDGTTQITTGTTLTTLETLVNGSKADTNLHFANLAATNKTIDFDFTTPKKIDEIRWFQVDETTYGPWRVRGSTDETTWFDLTTITLGGGTNPIYTFTNNKTYRYYRLLQTNATDSVWETRAYVYTWVNIYGEESPPSLPTTGAGDSHGIWTITNIRDPNPNPAKPKGWVSGDKTYAPYEKKYLYRTVTGASGQTTYYRLAEIPLGTTTYVDDGSINTDAILVNKLQLESTGWIPPKPTMKGMIAMPNGFLIGFEGSDVYMSEAYHWHAWPETYKYATETPIVGLGVLGQTCIICTEGYPATVTGTKPSTCSFTKATTGEPCMSRGSIVSTPQGVIYASQNGLMLAGPSGIQNVTKSLITREEWIRDYAPQYLRGVRYQEGYLALRMYPTGSGKARTGFFLDPTDLSVALTALTDFANVKAINMDFWSGEVFLLNTNGANIDILRWDPPTTTALMPIRWLSKEFQYVFKENFGCFAIYWDDARYSNYDWGTSIMPTTEKIRFKAWANRVLVYDQVVPRNGAPVRLPSGFKSDIWQFEIRSRAPVYSLHVAATMKELKGA